MDHQSTIENEKLQYERELQHLAGFLYHFGIELCNRNVGVHPHVALSATRGKASPSLKEFFQPCFLAALEESFQPCLLAAFMEQMFL